MGKGEGAFRHICITQFLKYGKCGERDRETAQCWQRGRGEGCIYWVPLLQRGIGGGLGINLLHFGEEGGGPLTTTINISPYTSLSSQKTDPISLDH